MHLNGRPVTSFDPEGLIFAAGIESRQLKLYDLRTFDKVCMYHVREGDKRGQGTVSKYLEIC